MLRPFYIHCEPDQGYDERFDTVMMVNGSVAVLNQVTKNLLGYPGVAIDGSYPGANLEGKERKFIREYLSREISQALSQGDEPVVYCTLLSYNARNSLELLKELKQEFGGRVRTGVGGQLVGVYPEAYLKGEYSPYIDQVATGDAEVCLGPMLLGRESFVTGEKMVTSIDHYAPPCYENYLGLDERLEEMARYELGDMIGIRQLITESVRGCSWAYAIKKACKFCALKGVREKPIFRSLPQHFCIERELVERYGVNWIFDVSNQWIPVVGPEATRQWLARYVEARVRYNGPPINRYVYLTTNAITEDTAPLLRQAGVGCVYIGIDGWTRETKKANYKTLASSEIALEACRAHGIKVRTSLVIGSGLTPQALTELPKFVADTMDRFGDTIISFGNFIELVIPGSEDWWSFQEEAERSGLKEASQIYANFEHRGFLTLDEEDRLNELRIRHTQRAVDYREVVAARDAAVAAVKQSQTLSVTIRDCEKLSRD